MILFPLSRIKRIPEGIATVLALKQALKQLPSPTARLPGVAAIFVELGLHGFKHLGLDQSRNQDANPVLTWHILHRRGLTRLQGLTPLGAQARTQRPLTGFTKS